MKPIFIQRHGKLHGLFTVLVDIGLAVLIVAALIGIAGILAFIIREMDVVL